MHRPSLLRDAAKVAWPSKEVALAWVDVRRLPVFNPICIAHNTDEDMPQNSLKGR